MSSPLYQLILQKQLSLRCQRNPQYSMRAFASSLGIHYSTLSRALAGRATIGERGAMKIANQLSLSPREKDLFVSSIAVSKRSVFKPRTEANVALEQKILDDEVFEAISDISHYGALELTFVKDFQSDPAWIAKKLGISKTKAKLTIDRLLRLHLLKKEKGNLVKNSNRILSGFGVPSKTTAALRQHQRQSLHGALESLDLHPIERRCMVSMTIPSNPDKIALAKMLIESFSQEVCNLLSDGELSEVYQLQVSLYPFQKTRSETEK